MHYLFLLKKLQPSAVSVKYWAFFKSETLYLRLVLKIYIFSRKTETDEHFVSFGLLKDLLTIQKYRPIVII